MIFCQSYCRVLLQFNEYFYRGIYAEDLKSGHPSCRIWHEVFASDEGDAEGDAADCRQADNPVHCRRGAGERD